jgi:hypothetical protein
LIKWDMGCSPGESKNKRMKSLPEIEAAIARFEEQLVPIAKRPVDIRVPGWVEKLMMRPPALDEAGIREPAEALLMEILDLYAKSDEVSRAALRDLFHQYQAFSWAAALPQDPSPEGFRRLLLLFSLKDQGRDSRDAIVWLQEICRKARAAGVDLKAMLEEAERLSSEVNRFGMGSTKDMIRKERVRQG